MVPTFESAMSAIKADAGDRTAEELTTESIQTDIERELEEAAEREGYADEARLEW